MWGNESPHSQVSSHFGNWSLDGLLNFQKAIIGVKTHCIEFFLYHGKVLEIYMSKMGSYDPFRYLKDKLWPKEGPRVKLPIWFPTTKSKKIALLTCVKMLCHISLESYRRGLQVFFKHHFNWRYAQNVMGLQNCKSLNFENFRTSNLGVSGQNDIWVLGSSTNNTIRGGKVVVSPKSPSWWGLWIRVCSWLVRAPKIL